jgi:hypothetical protein
MPAERDPEQQPEPAHPADMAIAGGVLTGVLLRRTGRNPSALDTYLQPALEPAHA